MRAAALRTVVRVEDLRLLRARRALADAAAAEEAARAAHAEAEARVGAARDAWHASDGDFRTCPQCEQRAWLRDLANERLLAAVDAELGARDAREAAEDAARAACAALAREEERASRFEELHRAARAGERETRDAREEEDGMAKKVEA